MSNALPAMSRPGGVPGGMGIRSSVSRRYDAEGIGPEVRAGAMMEDREYGAVRCRRHRARTEGALPRQRNQQALAGVPPRTRLSLLFVVRYFYRCCVPQGSQREHGAHDHVPRALVCFRRCLVDYLSPFHVTQDMNLSGLLKRTTLSSYEPPLVPIPPYLTSPPTSLTLNSPFRTNACRRWWKPSGRGWRRRRCL